MIDSAGSGLAAIRIADVAHRYGDRQALDGVSLSIAPGEIFAFLGPNGSGKTTLFRLLSTLIPLQAGQIEILGADVRAATTEVRQRIGVVFQAPSLDKKLTAAENLWHQGHLYGLSGQELRARSAEMLDRLGVAERAGERVEALSGGLRRRVELAKGLLHRPRVLLLDEPSTGLDPAARSDLWRYLTSLARDSGVTIAVTTHILDEAEKSDRLAILHAGQVVACDTPSALRGTVGGDSLTLASPDPRGLAEAIRAKFRLPAEVIGGDVRLQTADAAEWVARLLAEFGPRIETVTLGKPSLEDVFIARTGHRFWEASAADAA
ncbi:MAG: ABC transporter ATP-binding protein [Planctomycetaceae bacterium]|nr:ABC transporter ATP-binding protein [Planctomycetaceae bacterium]